MIYLYFWIFKQWSKNLLQIKIVLRAISDGFSNIWSIKMKIISAWLIYS